MNWFDKFEVIRPDASSSVEQVVRDTIRQFLNKGVVVEPSSHLLTTLHLSSDDLSKIALMLEDSFGITVPKNEYRDIHTTRDFIELFQRYLDRSKRSPG